jgi:hypothetical protein
MAFKPSTVRVRVAEALVEARTAHQTAERAHQQAPSDQTRRDLERALRELEILERRVVQVSSDDW